MKVRTLTLTTGAIFGGRHASRDQLPSVGGAFEQQKPIRVVLPHGEMELHPTGNVLAREEYYELTRAVGLVEAGAVMSHHGLGVGEMPARDLDLTHELAA
jgi:hypothetical protein